MPIDECKIDECKIMSLHLPSIVTWMFKSEDLPILEYTPWSIF